jgi:DNA-binding NarL/FixJ family response regulator
MRKDSSAIGHTGRTESRGLASPIRILIADASRMACQLMATAFEHNPYAVEVTALAVDASELRRAVKETQPDVAVVSTSLKEGRRMGFQAARELWISGSDTKVIMLIDGSTRAMVIEAFRAGARGVVCRDDPFETLCKSIHVVHQGQVWVRTDQLLHLIGYMVQTAPPAIGDINESRLLTKREQGVVRLVSEGLTNREISRQLNLSEHTVRNYLFRIFNKLGTSTRVELALYANNLKQLGGLPEEEKENQGLPLPQ